MTAEDRTLLVVLTIAAIGLPVWLGRLLHWPVWVQGVVIVLLLLTPFAVYRRVRHRIELGATRRPVYPVPLDPEPVEPAHPQFEREIVMSTGLASAVPEYEFLFSATVLWRPTSDIQVHQHANPAALAVAAIIERAEAVTAQEPPHRYTVALHRLNGVLGTVLTDRTGAVEAWAGQVQLTLNDGDLERLQKLADIRKDEQVWEYERLREQNRRSYYGNDVFKDPGSALVWWLSHTEDDVDVQGAVELIGALAQLSAAANNKTVPELLPALLSLESGERPPAIPTAPPDALTAVRDLLASLDLEIGQQALFVRRLVRAAEVAGRPDIAADIEAMFEPSAPEEPSAPPAAWDESEVDEH
ncbi:MAG TPA: hypothetical protein VHF06_15045 [Pseudonocardiaceae bacterium]|jgi:hypothetical protein|nr:hypothetical protein [Pseudonocardiaceae bacterium]